MQVRRKPPTRQKGGRPQLRACYGPHIKEILNNIPASLAVNNDQMNRTIAFLDKLADYLMSEEYANKSRKGLAHKAAWVAKRTETATRKA